MSELIAKKSIALRVNDTLITTYLYNNLVINKLELQFYTEQTSYEKTSLSDLQGAWENFKHTLLCLHPFPGSDRIIFHLNEAMSWEMVRDLKKMKDVYLLFRNMCLKSEKPRELKEDLEEIKECLEETVEECWS